VDTDAGIDDREATFAAGVRLFDQGDYLAAHELFEELWESSEAGDADFYKGLVQAAIALHHLGTGNLEGAEKLHSGQRRFLAPFLPHRHGIDLQRFLREMQACLASARNAPAGTPARIDPSLRPRLVFAG
jgi:predicted metal-dependent hydrolase